MNVSGATNELEVAQFLRDADSVVEVRRLAAGLFQESANVRQRSPDPANENAVRLAEMSGACRDHAELQELFAATQTLSTELSEQEVQEAEGPSRALMFELELLRWRITFLCAVVRACLAYRYAIRQLVGQNSSRLELRKFCQSRAERMSQRALRVRNNGLPRLTRTLAETRQTVERLVA